MFKKSSTRRRYLFAGLVAIALGGTIVAVGTRAAPKLMQGMCEKMMRRWMPEQQKQDCESGDRCQQMMASRGATAEHQTCEA